MLLIFLTLGTWSRFKIIKCHRFILYHFMYAVCTMIHVPCWIFPVLGQHLSQIVLCKAGAFFRSSPVRKTSSIHSTFKLLFFCWIFHYFCHTVTGWLCTGRVNFFFLTFWNRQFAFRILIMCWPLEMSNLLSAYFNSSHLQWQIYSWNTENIPSIKLREKERKMGHM